MHLCGSRRSPADIIRHDPVIVAGEHGSHGVGLKKRTARLFAASRPVTPPSSPLIHAPKATPFAAHTHVGFGSRHDNTKAYITPDNGLELCLPLTLKSEVRAKRPIMFADRGHEGDCKVNIAVLS